MTRITRASWQGPHACKCGGAGAPCPSCNNTTGDELPKLPFTPDESKRH